MTYFSRIKRKRMNYELADGILPYCTWRISIPASRVHDLYMLIHVLKYEI